VEDPPTLVLDDERTVIDGAQPDALQFFKQKVACRLARLRRAMVSGSKSAASVSLIVGLALWAYAERERSQELQREMSALSERRSIGHFPPESKDAGQHGSVAAPRKGTLHRLSPVADGVDPSDAAELIIQNRLDLALHQYRQLAVERASEPVYSDVVQVLRSKLACRVEAGLPCDP
jgi:hypothetical protein